MAVVAETGNQPLACERAKVSRSWVHLHRSTDPAFRAELNAAVATARARLAEARAAGASMASARGWGTFAGEELVARGGNGRRTQIARARIRQWTPRAEQRFLDVLAGSANVKAACAAVGLTPVSAYNHRQRWSSFRAAWDKALAVGYVRIETAMIGQLGAMLGSGMDADGSESGITPDLTITHMTCQAAMGVLWLHQRTVRGTGNRPGALLRRVASADETRAEILRKVAAIKARNAMAAEEIAAAERAVAQGAVAVAFRPDGTTKRGSTNRRPFPGKSNID